MRSVWLVCDDAALRDALALGLTRAGHPLTVCTSVEELSTVEDRDAAVVLHLGEGPAPVLDAGISVLRLEEFGGAAALRHGPKMHSPVRLGKLLRAIADLD